MGSEQRSAPARLGRMLKLIDALSERLCAAYTAHLREGLRRQRYVRQHRLTEQRSRLTSR